MKKHTERRDLRSEFLELAKTNQQAADILLIEEQNFDAARFLGASNLVASLRWFQAMAERGVPFSQVTPEFIVDAMKRGEAAIAEFSRRLEAQPQLQADAPSARGLS